MKKNQYRRYIFWLVAAVLTLAAGLLDLTGYRHRQDKRLQQQSVVDKIEVTPSNQILTAGELTLYQQKYDQLRRQLTVVVVAEAPVINVVAYDLLIQFDPANLIVDSVTSSLPEFDLFQFRRDFGLIVTAVKKPTVDKQTYFSKTQLIQLNFKIIKSGRYDIKLVSRIGKEKTQLVDSQTKVYYPKINQLVINIL